MNHLYHEFNQYYEYNIMERSIYVLEFLSAYLKYVEQELPFVEEK
jgi:hypothetical protein